MVRVVGITIHGLLFASGNHVRNRIHKKVANKISSFSHKKLSHRCDLLEQKIPFLFTFFLKKKNLKIY